MFKQFIAFTLFLLIGSLYVPVASAQNCVTDTGYTSTLVLPPTFEPKVDGAPAPDGTEIRIVAPDGECVGHLTYTNESEGLSIPIWGEDAEFNQGPGISAGAEFSVQIKAPADTTWHATEVTYVEGSLNNTSEVYHHNQLYVAETIENESVVTTRDGISMPSKFDLKGNYPNPFNPTTNITFDLPARAQVSVAVYDLLGRQVMAVPNRMMAAGARRSVQIDASSLSSGTYLYRVEAQMSGQRQVQTGRMMLVK